MTTSPRDTSAQPAIVHLSGMMRMGDSAYIEEQEARGQREMINATTLPRVHDLSGQTDADFEALGFTFGEQVDDLFREATLPEDWGRTGSGHSMWTYIVDERGLHRVAVFYKAAFYDREAFMRLVDVGHDQASTAIYHHDADIPWDLLTQDEIVAAKAELERYLANAEEFPDIYGDNAPRARALLEGAPA